jgi:hypothetical protein
MTLMKVLRTFAVVESGNCCSCWESCPLFINPLSIYRLHASIMRLASAALSVARVHVKRATIGGCRSLPLLFAPYKSISLGGRPCFAEMVARKKSTMTSVDAPSGEYRRAAIDLNVLIGAGSVLTGVLTFAITCFGFYSAIASNIETRINGVESKINGAINGVESRITSMLESKLDAQDRKLAGQDRKVEGFGEKIVLHDLKYEPKKNRSWFEHNSSPVKSDDRTISSVISIFSDILDAKFEAVHDVTNNLNAKVEAIRNATNNLDSKLNVMQDELNAKTKDGSSSSSSSSSKK